MNEVLPLEFKLKLRGKVVGFMKICDLQMVWWSKDGGEWHTWSKFAIDHDEKCQWTGYVDREGWKIYFGDLLASPVCEGDFVVRMRNGKICAKSGNVVIEPTNFDNRKIVEAK